MACAICLLDENESDNDTDDAESGAIVKIGCGHTFHVNCVIKWALHQTRMVFTCPTCRVVIVQEEGDNTDETVDSGEEEEEAEEISSIVRTMMDSFARSVHDHIATQGTGRMEVLGGGAQMMNIIIPPPAYTESSTPSRTTEVLRGTEQTVEESMTDGENEEANSTLDFGTIIARTIYDQTSLRLGWMELRDRIARNEPNGIRLCLDRHPVLKTYCTPGGYTAIMFAVVSGNIDCLDVLTAEGCDMRVTTNCGHNALHMAVIANQEVCAKYVIEKGVDVNAKARSGEAAIHIATQLGLPALCSILLNARANINIRDAKGQTIAHMLALNKSDPTLDYLLDKPDLAFFTADGFGNLPIHRAFGCANIRLLPTIIARTPKHLLDDTNVFGVAAMHVPSDASSEDREQLYSMINSVLPMQ